MPQPDMTFFGSDDLLEMKAILPFKAGGFSNWGVLCRTAMNLPMAVTLKKKKSYFNLESH